MRGRARRRKPLGGHLSTDVAQFLSREESASRRQEFAIFDGNVLLIHGLQRHEVVTKSVDLARGEPAICQPLPDEAIDGSVMLVRVSVIMLKSPRADGVCRLS